MDLLILRLTIYLPMAITNGAHMVEEGSNATNSIIAMENPTGSDMSCDNTGQTAEYELNISSLYRPVKHMLWPGGMQNQAITLVLTQCFTVAFSSSGNNVGTSPSGAQLLPN